MATFVVIYPTHKTVDRSDSSLKLQMNDLLHASLQIFGSVTSPCNSDTRDRLAKNNLKFTARCASHQLGVTASVWRII